MQDASPVDNIAEWSAWMPFGDALESAPRLPGVYMAREGSDGPIVYIGHAGERSGGRRPQGLRGRLRVYASGKALTSGLGEAVADRAFADAAWLRERLEEVERGEPMRAVAWGRAAFARANLYVRWAVTADKATAMEVERRAGALVEGQLWNRQQLAPRIAEMPTDMAD